jgi:hypothetical protein
MHILQNIADVLSAFNNALAGRTDQEVIYKVIRYHQFTAANQKPMKSRETVDQLRELFRIQFFNRRRRQGIN